MIRARSMVAELVWCLLLPGCAGAFSPIMQMETILTPREAEQRLQEAFVAYRIPVSERALDGRVSSGRFDPAGALRDRVVCGANNEADLGVRVEYVEVVGRIRESTSRPTRVEIESYGKGRNERGQEVSCRLDSAMVDALLASIPSYVETRG